MSEVPQAHTVDLDYGQDKVAARVGFKVDVRYFEESGQSWREKYEAQCAELELAKALVKAESSELKELLERYNQLRDATDGYTGLSLSHISPDEVAIKPHKRHKGQRKDWVIDGAFYAPVTTISEIWTCDGCGAVYAKDGNAPKCNNPLCPQGGVVQSVEHCCEDGDGHHQTAAIAGSSPAPADSTPQAPNEPPAQLQSEPEAKEQWISLIRGHAISTSAPVDLSYDDGCAESYPNVDT